VVEELTPFLLARVSTLTGGSSKRANLALLENNARVGAQIAITLAGS
jgi:pseudouridine-5'-phosphate glycosidase